MYRCRVTYDEWKCIIEKDRIGKIINNDDYIGYLGLLNIYKVNKPQIWKYNGKDLTVCDNNYKWLTIMPEDEYYCITVMMNDKSEIQVCYIDMIASKGYDVDEIPYFYDLYLDLVVYPDGTIIEDDMNELENALKNKDITQQQFDLAINTCSKLKNGLLSNIIDFNTYIEKMYDMIKC